MVLPKGEGVGVSVSICPICRGRGVVDENFYKDRKGLYQLHQSNEVPCKSCFGRGVIIVDEQK